MPNSLQKKRIPAFPPSAVAPAGVIAIPSGEFGQDLPPALQRAVIIADERPATATPGGLYSMSPYARAVDIKYCGKRHVLDVGGDPARPAAISASIKCQHTTILEYDDWMLLFCENCDSARAAEAAAKRVIDDPELRAVKNAETGTKSKGPYLISVTASGR